MKRGKWLALLAAVLLLPVFRPALSEQEEAFVTVGGKDMFGSEKTYTITHPDLIEAVRRELSAAVPAEAPEKKHSSYDIQLSLDGETAALSYDDLYGNTYMEKEGQLYRLNGDFGAKLTYPGRLWLGNDGGPDFSVREEYAAFLKEWGWTPFFTLAETSVTLPGQLTASIADEGDLYFTWADLFLRQAGFDLSPWLGRQIDVSILGLWETAERSRFVQSDLDRDIHVTVNLRCVLLHAEGEIIGGFIAVGRHNGEWMMSLDGKTALDLLNTDDPTAYLVSRAVLTEQEKRLARETPEEVIRQYMETVPGELAIFMPRAQLLSELSMNMNDDQMFVTWEEQLVMTLYWLELDGEEIGFPTTVVCVEPMREENVYRVITGQGEDWYVFLTWESEETGWKVKACYDHDV